MYNIQIYFNRIWVPSSQNSSRGRLKTVHLRCISWHVNFFDGPQALWSLQIGKPAYEDGSEKWWADVIQRTALGAGADADSWYQIGFTFVLGWIDSFNEQDCTSLFLKSSLVC